MTKQEETTKDTETEITQELEKYHGIENKEESEKIREKDKWKQYKNEWAWDCHNGTQMAYGANPMEGIG